MKEVIVIGAGLSGIVIARQLAEAGYKVSIIEKRSHIGGNCYDEYYNGILVHKYGPHIFHTYNKKIWDYINQFTEFNDYRHRVVSKLDGFINLPISLVSLFQIFNNDTAYNYKNVLIKEFEIGSVVGIRALRSCFNPIIRGLGNFIYKHIYENYSKKQWGEYFNKLDESVINRLMIRLDFNLDYFDDQYQGLPKDGYTKMFENMLFHKNIEVIHKDVLGYQVKDFLKDIVVYTGMIDELFDHSEGYLPYRSLDIKFETYNKDHYQEYPIINYPNKKRLTRKTEYKYLTKQESDITVISKEYPCEYDETNIPYYPIPTKDTNELYNKYKQLADKIPNLYLCGRLANYKYYDMDDAIENALNIADRIIKENKC